MGRRHTKHTHLPPHVTMKAGRYYYGRNQVALGGSYREMLERYAQIHGGAVDGRSFSDLAAHYLKHGTSHLAPKTRGEYERQMPRLVQWIGQLAPTAVTPHMVRRYLTERGNTVAATREKALLSAVFTHARNHGLFDGANPCAGVRGKKSRRHRYVADGELRSVMEKADPTTSAFIELCYLTGQRPSDVLKMTAQDVQEGRLLVEQGKTGAKVRIELAGPLGALVERLTNNSIGQARLVRDERGQPLTLSGIRKRFWAAREAAGVDWQIRDLRAKAATDLGSSREAQALLGHAAASTTDGYIRRVGGQVVSPVLRKTGGIAEDVGGKK